MGKILDSAERRFGHIAGNWAGYSIFGDKGADARRHIIQDARADAVRARESNRARIANEHYINSVDAAVLRNVDAVIGAEFSDNPNELVKHLMDLIVQVKTNSFKAHSDEEKVRTKYTYAVLAKLEQGVGLLEYIDPMNSRLNYITWQYLLAKWRKIFSIRRGSLSEDTSKFLWVFGGLGLVFAFGVLMAWIEKGGDFKDLIFPTIVISLGIILILISIKYGILGLCMLYHKIKRNHFYKQIQAEQIAIQKEEQERLIQEENIKMKQEEEAKKKLEEAERIKAAREEAKRDEERLKQEQEKKRIEEENARIKAAEDAKLPKMQRKYNALWEIYQNTHPILRRGYRISLNEIHKDILILGFNNQNIANSVSETYQFPLVEDYVGDRLFKMLKSDTNNLVGKAAYMDLFGFKEEYHAVAMKEIICNPLVFEYVAKQIALSQDIIEDIILPKLIITLDKDIWAFMGKIKGFTWMGYTYKTISNINGFELCEITGFSKTKDRISQDTRPATNLIGAKVLFADGMKPDNYPTPEDIIELIR